MTRIKSAIVCPILLPVLSLIATAGPLSPTTSSNVFALGSASIVAGNIQGALTAGGNVNLLSVNVGSIYAQGEHTPPALGTTLAISAPAGSTVVVNISGTSPEIDLAVLNGMSGSGQTFDPSHVLFNFPEATSLYLFEDTIAGTVLAPAADVFILGRRTSGTLITNDLLVAATNFFDASFAGDLTPPAGPDPPAVPEPSSVTLLGLGGAALLVL